MICLWYRLYVNHLVQYLAHRKLQLADNIELYAFSVSAQKVKPYHAMPNFKNIHVINFIIIIKRE